MFTPISYITPKNQTYFLDPKSTIRQALEKFDNYKFSVVPIVDEEGKFVGTVSEGDILRYIKNNCDFDIEKAETKRIVDIEKYRPYNACDINAPFIEILKLSLDQNFIPMVDDRGMYIGIIRRSSLINLLYGEGLENIIMLKDGDKIESRCYVSVYSNPINIYEQLIIDNKQIVTIKYKGNNAWERASKEELPSLIDSHSVKEISIESSSEIFANFDNK